MNKVLKSNSGQSLVLFLVLLLAILMFATFVIDLTNSKQNEKTLENTCKLIINYGLKHIDEDIEKKLENLLEENEKDLDDYKILIDKEKKEIDIYTKKSVKGAFGKIIGKDIYIIEVRYKGLINDEKIVYERVDIDG